MENHHHCLYCGDMISPKQKTCLKVACVQLYQKREIRCHKAHNNPNYIFKPDFCVKDCIGYRIIYDESGRENVDCLQVGQDLVVIERKLFKG